MAFLIESDDDARVTANACRQHMAIVHIGQR
jgi:hypothetical protein